jgi:hypothetical protein
MIMRLPEDYWEDEFIDTVLGPFARVVTRENDSEHLSRLLVWARVVDLESILHFSIFSDGLRF